MKIFTILSAAAVLLPAVAMADTMQEDPYIWLEDVEGEKALEWVEARNKVSLGYLQNLKPYQDFYDRNLEIYDSEDRITNPNQQGARVLNFWRDANNVRGLWRQTSLESYVAGEPKWDVIIDLDKLAEAEEENWVWAGAQCLRPDYNRCLISLSRGGADASVVREFDIAERKFVKDGFNLPEAKSAVLWVDIDHVYVGTDFGDGSLTDSGYPRIAKRWKRGQSIAEATTLFEGESTDVWNLAYRQHDGDAHYDFVRQAPSFFKSRMYRLGNDDKLTLVDIPEDAQPQGIFKGQFVVELKSAWKTGGHEYPQGALLAIDFERFMGGDRKFEVLVQPTETSAIESVVSTQSFLIVNHLNNVTNRLDRFEFTDGAWKADAIATQRLGNINLVSADDVNDTFFFTYEDFLTPDTLFVAKEGGRNIAKVKQLPAYFDADGMSVEQNFATSADGTKVPYFLVKPKGFEANGATPTLLYGYGGFEVSLAPSYSATVGHSWLNRGGAFVTANIRGGGEYGPDWHQAALKENRQRAYDDFIAVAEDLIARQITTPEHLGIRGGSNGGLLMGVMLTQRPDLFGGVVVQVPLLDMKRFNQLLAGASWMAEYGDPDTDDWQYISKYSPYQNLRSDTKYPKVFFTTSTRDDRVHPGHARKMVAKMDDMGIDLLYYENTEGGHAGASNNKQQAKVQALIYSYLWDQLAEGAVRSGP